MEKQFKYIFNNKEVNKEQFITLAKDSFKWFSDNTIQAVDFDSISKFFSGDYKSDNEIDKHFKGVLVDGYKKEVFDKLGIMPDNGKEQKSTSFYTNSEEAQKIYPNLGDYLNKSAGKSLKEELRELHDKVIEDWNKKEFYTTPPSKENLDKMCDSFEQRVKNDSDKCGIINKPVPECHSKIGQKHNEGKLPLDIMLTVQFPKAIQAVCKATLFGHEKYKDTDLDWLNYKRVRGGSTTYANACQRHNFNKSGKDDQSGLPHIVHKCWNALAELELWIEENKYE